MPNHVATNLIITGPSADVRRFVAAVDRTNPNLTEDHDDQGKTFDFNGVVPIPDELKNTTSPTRIMEQSEIDTMWAEWNKRKDAGELKDYEIREGKPWGLGISRDQSNQLIFKYGADNWYNWKNSNWGTKWGAYDATPWDVTGGENGNATASIHYNTAWGPANEFFINASKLFPTLTFDTEYADEGGGFVCETSYENGEITADNEYDWEDKDGLRVRESVGYGPSDDEEEQTEEDVETTLAE